MFVFVFLGGECWWVEIVCVLVSCLSYMLFDEFFVGIDFIVVGEIRELIGYLKFLGLGVLVMDYNVCEILDLIDWVYIIYDGEVFMEGILLEIVGNEDVWCVYLGDWFSF